MLTLRVWIKNAQLFACVFCMALWAGNSSATAQTYQFTNFDIQGNQRIEDATILNFGGLTTGQGYTGGQLNDAGQAIRGTGLFEEVEIIPRGGTLIIRVREYPTINRINFEGNARVSDAQLDAFYAVLLILPLSKGRVRFPKTSPTTRCLGWALINWG